MTNSPQVAISYSWSSSEHVQWVIDLASQLREYGVDVKLDKWDLKEGNDAIKFMEQMVSRPQAMRSIRANAERRDRCRGVTGADEIQTPNAMHGWRMKRPRWRIARLSLAGLLAALPAQAAGAADVTDQRGHRSRSTSRRSAPSSFRCRCHRPTSRSMEPNGTSSA